MEQQPSGEQFVIRSGGTIATVVEVGGALRLLAVDGHDLLDGYPSDAVCDGARGQSLLPWPNRVRDGRYRWQGQDFQLALTEPTNSCAIHGLTRWENWRCAVQEPSSVLMTYRLPPQPGWNWGLDLSLHYTVTLSGLTVRTTARNLTGTAAPFAAGAHPYLRAGSGPIDGATLNVPARSWLPTDLQQIPDGIESVEDTPYDFRATRPIGSAVIDHAYRDLQRDADGLARVRLRGEWVTELWADRAYPYLQVFTGDALPDRDRRRQGLGVEPMSAPPNALASGTDVVTIEPGATWTGEWGIALAE